MKLFRKFALIGCALLLIAWLFVTAIQDQQNSPATILFTTLNPMVGIWKGQHGVILDLRADGTARGRSIDDKTAIQYFEYRLHGDKFSIDYTTKPDEYLRRLNLALFRMSDASYNLGKLSKAELQLIDSASGETFVFARIEDSVLASAP